MSSGEEVMPSSRAIPYEVWRARFELDRQRLVPLPSPKGGPAYYFDPARGRTGLVVMYPKHMYIPIPRVPHSTEIPDVTYKSAIGVRYGVLERQGMTTITTSKPSTSDSAEKLLGSIDGLDKLLNAL